MKRVVCLTLALMLIYCAMLPVNAAASNKGSIEVSVQYQNIAVNGGDLTAVRVGYVDFENNVFRNVVTNQEINGIGESATVTQLQNFYIAYQNGFDFEVFRAEVKNGVGKFSGIPLGLYLIFQEKGADGFCKLSAFLVTVPYDGRMDVSVSSKSELKREAESKPTTPSGSDSTGSQKLPQTGQLTWPIPCLAMSGTALLALGWWLYFSRKEDS